MQSRLGSTGSAGSLGGSRGRVEARKPDILMCSLLIQRRLPRERQHREAIAQCSLGLLKLQPPHLAAHHIQLPESSITLHHRRLASALRFGGLSLRSRSLLRTRGRLRPRPGQGS
jgi:hypothetical protein